jgi:hypothetical protein
MVKPRPAQPTVKFVDTYCQLYRDLFVEVRAYECFKYLHVGLISELKRKSLPAFNWIFKWLKVFPISQLSLGFPILIAQMNKVDCLRYLVYLWDDFFILLPRVTKEGYFL